MPWLDNTAYVDRYAWFWADPKFDGGSLVGQTGDPTTLGKVYGYTPYGRAS